MSLDMNAASGSLDGEALRRLDESGGLQGRKKILITAPTG